jgi:hypothetical protein
MVNSSGQSAARNGSAFEMQLKAALENHPRYAANYQFRLESGKADGRPCRYDAIVYDRQTGERILISCKAQHSSGSTEEKVPFELLHLHHSLQSQVAERAYLVLFGNGFSRVKDFYLSKQFKNYMPKLAYGIDWPDELVMTNMDTLCGYIAKEKL